RSRWPFAAASRAVAFLRTGPQQAFESAVLTVDDEGSALGAVECPRSVPPQEVTAQRQAASRSEDWIAKQRNSRHGSQRDQRNVHDDSLRTGSDLLLSRRASLNREL